MTLATLAAERAADTGYVAAPRVGSTSSRSARHVVLRLTARRAARSGAVWGAVVALYGAIQALGYVDTYKTQASRNLVAGTLSNSSGLTALVGPGHGLNTVAGYTAWKCLIVLVLIAGVWGLLTSTRLIRGEEEAGRAEMVLSGQTNQRHSVISMLAGLGAGVVTFFAVGSMLAALAWHSHRTGIGISAAVYFVLAVACSAAMFLAFGALTSQLAATRREAAAWAGGALGPPSCCAWLPTPIAPCRGYAGRPLSDGSKRCGRSPVRISFLW